VRKIITHDRISRVVSEETAIRDHVVGMRRPSGERVWLSVNGAPQRNEDREFERAVFVFEAGYSTDDDGTGFGLRIVEQIADAHRWGVAVTAVPPKY